MSGRNRSSPVWSYFVQLKSTPRKLRCLICKDILPYNRTNTTARLLRHVKKHSIHFHVRNMINTKKDVLENDERLKKVIQSLNSENNTEATTIQKPRKSKVWQCFTTLSSGSTDNEYYEGHARCKFCPRVLTYNNGSTGNLCRHLKNLHKPIWAFLGQKNLPKKISNTHIIFSEQCEETASSDDGLIKKIKCEKDLDDTEINDCRDQSADQEQSKSLDKQFKTEDTALNNDSTINSIECAEASPALASEEQAVIEEIYDDEYIPRDSHCNIAAQTSYSASQLTTRVKKTRQHPINHRCIASSAAVMRMGQQKWFDSRTNFINTKTRCFVQEHRQKMRLQEIEHAEKMKLLQLQQELLKKQIEVEHSRIAQKQDR